MNLDRMPHDRAGFGSTVHLRAESGDTIVYQLVMPEEADAEKGMISTSSPIGRAILNKEEGDEIKVTTPNGAKQFELIKLITIHDEASRMTRAQYSPERRTALVLCGTGVHGAYHAGVLRALQEAGVKIDIMAGQGVGAAARRWPPSTAPRGCATPTASGASRGDRDRCTAGRGRFAPPPGWLLLLGARARCCCALAGGLRAADRVPRRGHRAGSSLRPLVRRRDR